MLDTLVLSRIQFASNITFHILFPTITIALGWFLFYFKLKFIRTNDAVWNDAYKFWVKVFALTFALGVVSGITMSFQFGTNWPGYMKTVGNVAGPLLAYEVLTAFFLEATFLGVMLFGSNRVSQKTHLVASFLVAFGTSLSAFWIIVLNSWMQTPQGYSIINGIVHADSWMEIIFNPSMPYRLAHMMTASFLTAAFFVAGISAYRSLRGSSSAANALTLKFAVTVAAALIPVQILLGDMHGQNTLEYQPAKLAAMEGIWETSKNVPAVLFAIPDASTKSNLYEIAIPNLASLYLTHSWDGEVKGLDAFGKDIPPVLPIFFAFRIMVGVGVLMLLISWVSYWRMRGRYELPKYLKIALVGMTFSGWVAVVSGWYVTEIGRQPFLVSGVLRTVDAVTTVSNSMVFSTLFMYLLLYVGLLSAYIWIVFYMARKADLPEATLGNAT
ncbi:cytochrome ubiquinol oxidase subunit I [Polynucleobacter brandtiae]|uniref:Cytochrome bd-I ubiquinol oxidase subunit 1 apoprotein n=1 Tax=Polynucleobacter brandtiae TaxID=1938816 RepID=A0A2M8VQQ6_9BURK|nr:cytochrome ubiquinol oxidase subunit I [Polynucleobacter brandtiae]PJI79501.1 cytochrome bd-I ubiquinol oxidase subunit 1 apoprotein [Polynucleobacter brandtiae]